MNHILICLLTLLFSLSNPAMGVGGGFGHSALAAESTAAKSFFDGAKYTPKVLQQMKGAAGEFHSFPESVKSFESMGKVRPITGGDKIVREMLEIPGTYGGRQGVFQFIKNADGTINHRLFIPNTP